MTGPVLLIGGRGFLGRRLDDQLRADGLDVVISSRHGSPDDHRIDIADPPSVVRAVRAIRPQVIVNLAVERGSDAATMHSVNGQGPRTILEVAAEHGVERLVHIGSVSEVSASDMVITDGSPFAPRGDYGATKAAGSRAVLESAAGLDVVVVRASYIYGPGEPPTRLIPTAWRAATTGAPMRLTEPDTERDWLHVEDAARAIAVMTVAPLPAGRVTVTAASSISTGNREIVGLVEAATGRPIRISDQPLPPRPWDVEQQPIARSGTLLQLGWKPEISLAEGIARYEA